MIDPVGHHKNRVEDMIHFSLFHCNDCYQILCCMQLKFRELSSMDDVKKKRSE